SAEHGSPWGRGRREPLGPPRRAAVTSTLGEPDNSLHRKAGWWTPRHTSARPGVDWRRDHRPTPPRPRLRADGPRLAQHGRPRAEPRGPARQDRPARLLDVLLHQLLARAGRAARARGAAPGRARGGWRALPEVRA